MAKQEQHDETIAHGTTTPFRIEIDAATPYADRADFSAAQWNNHHEKLRYKKANMYYLHTFQWGPTDRRHRADRAVLVVDMLSLSSGANRQSDAIMIVSAGGVQMGHYAEKSYISSTDRPVPGCSSVLNGKEVRKTWIIEGLPLQKLNDQGTLSIVIHDDTLVKSATLTVEGHRP